MIGAMDLHMAIQALLAQHALIRAVRRDTGAAVHSARMEIGEVTLLAQVRLPAHQEILVIRTVGHVAVGRTTKDGP